MKLSKPSLFLIGVLSLSLVNTGVLAQTCTDGTDYLLKKAKKDANPTLSTCATLASLDADVITKYCSKKQKYYDDGTTVYQPPHVVCSATCNPDCDECYEEPKAKYFHKLTTKGKTKTFTCKSLSKKKAKLETICDANESDPDGVYPSPQTACPETCGVGTCGSA